MTLSEDDLAHAPLRIRRVWEIVANPKLDCFRVPISSQLKGIDIEMFASEPNDSTPVEVCLSNCILRDIHLDREKLDEKQWEVRLNFSLGISWDGAVWKWGEHYVFMECYAKFSQSQSELFDDHPVDAEIKRPETPAEVVEQLAQDLGTKAPEATQTPATDPLLSEETPRRRGRGKRSVLPFDGKRGEPRPHA